MTNSEILYYNKEDSSSNIETSNCINVIQDENISVPEGCTPIFIEPSSNKNEQLEFDLTYV